MLLNQEAFRAQIGIELRLYFDFIQFFDNLIDFLDKVGL